MSDPQPLVVEALQPEFASPDHAAGVALSADRRTLLALPDSELDALLDRHGAVVFRGSEFSLDDFIARSGARVGALESDPTSRVAAGPSGLSLEPHGEPCSLGARPSRLWFYCQQAPSEAGQTTLVDGVELWRRLDAEVRVELERSELRYRRRFDADQWPTAFGCSTIPELEAICAANRVTLELGDDGAIETEFVCPASVELAKGVRALVTSFVPACAIESGSRGEASLRVRRDDGEQIPESLLARVRETAAAITVEQRWRPGEIMVVDNRRLIHGRRAALGSERKVFIRLGHDQPPRARASTLINLQFGTEPLVVHAQGHHRNKPHWPAIKAALFDAPPRSLGPVEALTLITCNNGHEAMGLFERSCAHLGVPCRVFGAGIEPWINAVHKPAALRDALAEIDTRYALYVDSRDAILFGSPHVLLERYVARFDAALVFGGDRMNWPPCKAFKQFESGLPGAAQSEFRFLNGGCWIGETEFCHAFFAEACETPPVAEAPESEQGILKQLFARHYPRVQLDYRCELFQNIGFVAAPLFELRPQ